MRFGKRLRLYFQPLDTKKFGPDRVLRRQGKLIWPPVEKTVKGNLQMTRT
jgi:hypothetical protein